MINTTKTLSILKTSEALNLVQKCIEKQVDSNDTDVKLLNSLLKARFEHIQILKELVNNL